MHWSLISMLSGLAALAIAASTPCNNSPSLCSRSYDNVTLLGAHDSAFIRDASTSNSLAGDQFYNSTVQLSAGVRLLTAQIYPTNATSGLHLCHTSCSLLDAGRLSTWLGSLKSWLDSNPNDVVTILLVNGGAASTASIADEFDAANITSYAFTPSSTASSPHTGASTWPTLQTLIDSNKRLITFIASLADDGSAAPYLLNEFDFIFENSYNYTSPTQFTCSPDRPSTVAGNYAAAQSAGLMPLMNHFVYTDLAASGPLAGVEIPDVSDIYATNAPTGSANCTSQGGCLGTTAQGCADVYERAPWAVLVDFFNVGPAIETVDSLNGVTDAVGRISVSGVAAAEAVGAASASASASGTATSSGTQVAQTSTAATSTGASSSASATKASGASGSRTESYWGAAMLFATVLLWTWP